MKGQRIHGAHIDEGGSHHSLIDPDKTREQVRDFMIRHLGLELEPHQEQILNQLWPFRATQLSAEADYIKHRINARLRGINPGPYNRQEFQ